MKNTKIQRLIAAICMVAMLISLSIPVNAATIENSHIQIQTKNHVQLDSFDGYESHEVNPTGRVGYNIALPLPNGETIKIGFDPRNTLQDAGNEYYSLAAGWQIKLPYFCDSKYYKADGYSYNTTKSLITKATTISNYPIEHNICYSKDGSKGNSSEMCLEEPYGMKEYYNNGNITKSVNVFGEVTEYVYKDNKLSEIVYPTGGTVSISFDTKNCIEMSYTENGISTVFARFMTADNSIGTTELREIVITDGIHVAFDYLIHKDILLLNSYNLFGEHQRRFSYEHTAKLSRVSEMNTEYSDGDTSYAIYKYDTSGNISKISMDDAVENYDYSVSINGDLIVNVCKVYQGESRIYKDVYNKYGQLTQYSYPGNTLTLQYDSTNRIIAQTENELTVNMAYNDYGLLATAEWSNGKTYDYSYSETGKLTSSTVTCDGVTSELPKENEEAATAADSSNDSGVRRAATTVSVEYDVNNDVSVLNWHKVYGLAQDSFNCYTYAIGRTSQKLDPGMLSGKTLQQSAITASLVKKYTEQDQEKLGRRIYDSTVSETHNSHSWKIALRVKAGYDYHFMKKNYSSSTHPTHWEFKAGVPGPVMRLRNNKTPSGVTWDMYKFNWLGKCVVDQTGFYNSGIYYMIIAG